MVVGGLVLWGLPERRRNHFIAYRFLPRRAAWEIVDSVGPRVAATSEEVALQPSDNKFFVVHTDHRACGRLPHIGPGASEAYQAETLGPSSVATSSWAESEVPRKL